jgi:hypothetical protein
MTKKTQFLISLVVGILVILTVNAAKATTADDTVCPAGSVPVCFTKQADGSLAKIQTDGQGHAVTVHERCTSSAETVYFGCQPDSAIRAEEREECEGLDWPYFWSETRGGRCVERRPRDTPPAPPPTPPTPPQTPPIVQTPPTPPQGGSQDGGTITFGSGTAVVVPGCPQCPNCNCPPVPPVPPGPPATCPDCNVPDPCTDIPALAAELTPLEQIPADQWIVHTDTDTVRSRVLYIRERAGDCAEDDLFAAADRVLAAMTPPPPPPILPQTPDSIAGSGGTQGGDWCSENKVACGFLIAGAILAGGAVVTTGILLGTDYHIVQ